MSARRLHIAIVDDEQCVRKALRRLFSASNLNAETFASGQAFLDSLERERPDCLVLDLHMPGLSGLDVLRHPAVASTRLPTIIITAHDDPATHAQCLAAGAAAYLCKPLDDETFLAAVTKAAALAQRTDS